MDSGELLTISTYSSENANPVSASSFAPTAIDLFSGCGGLTQGLKAAGFHVLAAVEIDPLAADTYSSNHPEVKIWAEDIRRLHPRLMKRVLKLQTGQLDLLAGCPPCQGFSSIRTLQGKRSVDDPNNALLYRFLQFIKELKPKAVLMENVPALAADKGRMTRFLAVLEMLGYIADDSIIKVLNTADYGVPQRRRRMILLTSRIGRITLPKPEAQPRTVREAIGHLPPAGRSGDPLHDILIEHNPDILERIRRIPIDGGSRSALGEADQLPCHQRANGFKDIYGRMAWDKVAPTITGGCINPSKGRFLHPVEHRAITLREAALLQSFPEDYKFSLKHGKFRAALLIGNALPPEFVRQQALQIRDFLWNHHKKVVPSDLTEEQWEAIKPLLPLKWPGVGRPRVVDLRDVVNALRYCDVYKVSTKYLPSAFPPATTVSYYYYVWRRSGLWQQINDRLAVVETLQNQQEVSTRSQSRPSRRGQTASDALRNEIVQIGLELGIEVTV